RPQELHELEDGTQLICAFRLGRLAHRPERRAKRPCCASLSRSAPPGADCGCSRGARPWLSPEAETAYRMRGASSLNSGVPATPSRSNSTVSVLVSVAPAFSQRCRPIVRFSSVRETMASSGTNTAKPPRRRSRTVWKTQTCASIPRTITCFRPVRRISRAIGWEAPQENSIFSTGAKASSSRSSESVSPSPFLYCSLATTGRPSLRAALSRMPAFFVTRAMPSSGIARASFSCTSTRSSSAPERARASVRGSGSSDGIALGSALGRRVRVQRDVHAGDRPGGDGALQGGPDCIRLLHVLPVAAQRLHHLVVAGLCQERRRALLGS